MLKEEYPKLGSVFTLKLLNKKITFLIGPEVSAHFFKAPESDLSQQELYQFNVLHLAQGWCLMWTILLGRSSSGFSLKLLGLISSKVMSIRWLWRQRIISRIGESGEVDLKYDLDHLIILTTSRCMLGEEVRNKLFDDLSSLFHDLDDGMRPTYQCHFSIPANSSTSPSRPSP